MISRLSHTTIYVLDQEAALSFYTDKLGFRPGLNVGGQPRKLGGFQHGAQLSGERGRIAAERFLEPDAVLQFSQTGVESGEQVVGHAAPPSSSSWRLSAETARN